MDDYGKLATLAAMRASVCEAYDEVRARCDRQAARDGTRSRVVSIGGQPCATYVVPWRNGPELVDMDEFAPWAVANCLGSIRYQVDLARIPRADAEALVACVAEHWPEAVVPTLAMDKGWEKWVADGGGGACVTAEDGEVVPGCRWACEPTASKVMDVGAANRRVRPEKVARALAAAGMQGMALVASGEAFADEPEIDTEDTDGQDKQLLLGGE